MSDRPIDFRLLLSYNQFEVDAVDDYKEKFITLFQEMTKALLTKRSQPISTVWPQFPFHLRHVLGLRRFGRRDRGRFFIAPQIGPLDFGHTLW